ncbi:MAG: hypothetical protein NC305_07980 [Lachnospiraceae bacterium]|nr:hypothetical protein [Butyrivibrio sp.]MCM1342843.1 hypothetical protein [Muribaculaceae bacterium]MCM1410470.1 hypothetical protein [Lachnospiraceae bacterium]
MGFWRNLFQKRKTETEVEENWEEIVYPREKVDFHDEEQRSRYITDCLEQMAEASREIEHFSGEYDRVTSYLTDMEEIEALPEQDRQEINTFARKLLTLEQEREHYQERKDRMSDTDYYQMRKQEEDLEEGLAKLKQAEEYGGKIKQDMRRLETERQAYEFRRTELEAAMQNFRGMAVIFLTAFAVCLVMLLILQFGFEYDTKLGMLLAVAAAAIALSVLCIRFIDSDREYAGVANAINRLIQLQNKVKIRYVNNRSLVDYFCLKYDTDSAARLEKKWNHYQREKEQRKQYAEAEAKLEYYQDQLVARLSRYRVKDPERWVGQPGALLDKREMVEIRHDLILRRQALRKQMDYNNNIGENARQEVKDVAKQYPMYMTEILAMVERYDKQG